MESAYLNIANYFACWASRRNVVLCPALDFKEKLTTNRFQHESEHWPSRVQSYDRTRQRQGTSLWLFMVCEIAHCECNGATVYTLINRRLSAPARKSPHTCVDIGNLTRNKQRCLAAHGLMLYFWPSIHQQENKPLLRLCGKLLSGVECCVARIRVSADEYVPTATRDDLRRNNG